MSPPQGRPTFTAPPSSESYARALAIWAATDGAIERAMGYADRVHWWLVGPAPNVAGEPREKTVRVREHRRSRGRSVRA